ncbi:LysM domain-containing protein [Caulobacter sp. B11]|uniref:LysM peptidoglycan-binding domain-containing protein n=1 Tax=Caulobacter sp. B11 TaxID=2048899 RepID=UPI0026F43118|nr:LysM domain-containing protein [Caulobacter sp. B11]
MVVTQVGGPVVDVTGAPKIHVVESGDAIDAIARGLGTTRAELAKDNDLEPPYRIKPGQKLKGRPRAPRPMSCRAAIRCSPSPSASR